MFDKWNNPYGSLLDNMFDKPMPYKAKVKSSAHRNNERKCKSCRFCPKDTKLYNCKQTGKAISHKSLACKSYEKK